MSLDDEAVLYTHPEADWITQPDIRLVPESNTHSQNEPESSPHNVRFLEDKRRKNELFEQEKIRQELADLTRVRTDSKGRLVNGLGDLFSFDGMSYRQVGKVQLEELTVQSAGAQSMQESNPEAPTIPGTFDAQMQTGVHTDSLLGSLTQSQFEPEPFAKLPEQRAVMDRKMAAKAEMSGSKALSDTIDVTGFGEINRRLRSQRAENKRMESMTLDMWGMERRSNIIPAQPLKK